MIPGDEVVERLPALAGREPTSGYLFYDCQTDDARLVLTVLAEAERFGAVCANRLEVTRARRGGRQGARRLRARPRDRRDLRRARANVVNATGVWADRLRPGELHDEAEVPRHPRRAAARTSRCPTSTLPLIDGAIVPAGSGRSIFALPWLGSTLIGTTDNDYDSDEPRPHPARRRRHRVPARRDERVLRQVADAVGPQRRVRRRAAADLDRRPEEVGRHLAQGRALRDEQRDDHDHRRQAHDLAADGEDDRRPDRRARRPRRAVPHARDPARPGASRPPTCRASRACPTDAYERLAGRYGHHAHDVLAVAAERGELAQPIVARRARRTCSPRPSTPRAASRPAASATRCCAARASGLLAAREVADPAARSRGASRARWRRSSAGTRRAPSAQAQAFLDEAAAEGIAAGSRAGA